MALVKRIFTTLAKIRNIRVPSLLGRKLLFDLIISFILLAIVPTIAISIFTLERSRNQAIDQITQQLESVAEFKQAQIANWFEENRFMLDVFMADSQRAAMVTAVLEGNASPETVATINRVLLESTEANRFFGGLFLYDTRGRVIAASEEREIKKIVRRQSYFDPSIENPNHIEPPYFDVTRNQLVVVQTRQISNSNGEVIGVLAGWLETKALGDIMLERAGLGERGETYLVSLENNYFLTPSYFEGYTMNQAYESKGIDQALSRHNGSGIYNNYRGQTVIGVYHWMPELQVGLLAEIEQNEALALFKETTGFIALLTIVAALLAAGAGIFIALRITRPISRLKTLAERLSNGDLTARATINSRNELGVLGEAFNNMANDLNNRIESEQTSRAILEETVSEYMIFVEQVADGNLATRLDVDSNGRFQSERDDLYMLGKRLNAMVENLRDMTIQVRETAAAISSATLEIQAASTQQIATATEQDAAVTQTLATTEEVRTTVSQTSERAQLVADTSQRSIEASRQGQQAVSDSIQGMETIREQVEEIARNILELSERTQQIGNIIETVNAIADQSKLLALNASIEAARAGEEGRGFSVVALEVRQLAEQSREATDQVREILSEIQQSTNLAVMVTEEGSKGAEKGMQLVDRAGEVIEELVATLEGAAQAASQISASAHQQISGMDQLNTAMASIKQASVQTASSTQQTEQSVRQLIEMAQAMEQAVARYQLGSTEDGDTN